MELTHVTSEESEEARRMRIICEILGGFERARPRVLERFCKRVVPVAVCINVVTLYAPGIIACDFASTTGSMVDALNYTLFVIHAGGVPFGSPDGRHVVLVGRNGGEVIRILSAGKPG